MEMNGRPAAMIRFNAVTVQALINTIVGAEGATLDDVAATLAGLAGGDGVLAQQIAKALTGKTNPTAAELTAALGKWASAATVQELLDALAVAAPGAGTVAGVQAMWQAASDANTVLYTLINTLAGKPSGGGTVADVLPALQAAITAIAESVVSRPLNGPVLVKHSFTAGKAGDAEVVAYSPDNKPVNLNLLAPGGVVKANGQPILNEVEIRDAVMEWLKVGVFLGSPRMTDARVGSFFSAGGEGRVVTFEHVDGSTWLRISNGENGPEIGVVQHQLVGASDSDIRIRPRGRGALVVGTATATATVRAAGDLNDVDLRLEAQGNGKVTAGGSRVLTEADLASLGTGSGAVDAAVVEAAVNTAVATATAPLLERITTLEATVDALQDAVQQYINTNDAAVAENTSNVQQIFDVFAHQEGGSIRQLKAFYDNLTAFLTQAMGAFGAFGSGAPEEAVRQFLDEVNGVIETLMNKDAELTQNDADIVDYVVQQLASVSAPDLSGYATKTDLAAYAKVTDANQVLTAKSITVGGIKFTDSGEILAPVEDEYGKRLRLLPPDLALGDEVPIVVVHTDLQDILGPRTGNDLELVDLVTQDMLNSGRAVAEQDWADCQIINGAAGTVPVQARVVNGVVQLQGDLKYTYTSTGTYVDVAQLPEGVPAPAHDLHFPIYGIESGVSYRIGLCRVQANGRVQLACVTGKVTAISLGNITYPAQ